VCQTGEANRFLIILITKFGFNNYFSLVLCLSYFIIFVFRHKKKNQKKKKQNLARIQLAENDWFWEFLENDGF